MAIVFGASKYCTRNPHFEVEEDFGLQQHMPNLPPRSKYNSHWLDKANFSRPRVELTTTRASATVIALHIQFLKRLCLIPTEHKPRWRLPTDPWTSQTLRNPSAWQEYKRQCVMSLNGILLAWPKLPPKCALSCKLLHGRSVLRGLCMAIREQLHPLTPTIWTIIRIIKLRVYNFFLQRWHRVMHERIEKEVGSFKTWSTFHLASEVWDESNTY